MYTIEEVAANINVEVWKLLGSLLDNEWLDPKAYKEGKLEIIKYGESLGKLKISEDGKQILFPEEDLSGLDNGSVRAGIKKIDRKRFEELTKSTTARRRPSKEDLERSIRVQQDLLNSRRNQKQEELENLKAELDNLKTKLLDIVDPNEEKELEDLDKYNADRIKVVEESVELLVRRTKEDAEDKIRAVQKEAERSIVDAEKRANDKKRWIRDKVSEERKRFCQGLKEIKKKNSDDRKQILNELSKKIEKKDTLLTQLKTWEDSAEEKVRELQKKIDNMGPVEG